MSTFWWVSLAYFVFACIHTLDKRLIQARREGVNYGMLPSWISHASEVMYAMQIWMLVLDWKRALVLFVIALFWRFYPCLSDSNLLCAPVKRKEGYDEDLDARRVCYSSA